MKKLILLCAIVIAALQSDAQLYLQNNTALPLRVAFIIPVNNSYYRGLVSHGWETVQPRERKMLTAFTNDARAIYYYAESSRSSFGGSSNFLVDSAATFNILEPDIKYRRDGAANYWRPFKRVEMPAGCTTYTIVLND